MSPGPVLLVLGESGLATARRLRGGLEGAEIHGLAARVAGIDRGFEDVADHARRLFRGGTPIVGLCAAGLLIRVLAPCLRDKTAEPPVLVVAEDGSAVVPLLGGHRGGNALAGRIADILGVAPALTTAGELRFGVALDAPPAGWCLANPGDMKAFSAALLAGEPVRLDGDAPWLAESRLPLAANARHEIVVGDRAIAGNAERLVYHPKILALGVGCARDAAPETVLDLVRESLAEAGLAVGAVACVVSIDVKADEAAIHHVAHALDAPARFFDAARLEAETPRLANPSDVVFRAVGCHGVAEAAALAAAAGSGGVLVMAKRKSDSATCAVARAPAIIDGATVGRARGRLAVVGIGPGAEDWRTPEAARVIAEADDLVGYGRYLDLLGAAARGQRRHDFALGEEQARVRHALDLAARGRAVALICSGDPGIYAMAALVFEELDRGGRVDWRRVAVTVAPGLTAMQAAAARVGAPLGHDFCAISLSDLLTPRVTIERRLRAAAEGDFVVALYNPVSRRRRDLLVRAREILLARRPADTPVVLARNLGRAGESVRVVTLAALTADMADMLTLVLVGASTTRLGAAGRWVYTPRGYGDKAAGEDGA